MAGAGRQHVTRPQDIRAKIRLARAPDPGLGGDMEDRSGPGDGTIHRLGLGDIAPDDLDAAFFQCWLRRTPENANDEPAPQQPLDHMATEKAAAARYQYFHDRRRWGVRACLPTFFPKHGMPMNDSARPLPRWPFALAVAILALLPLLPALGNGFVWDDELNITANEGFRGLDAEHLLWMATSFHAGHYQPLTWLSYAVNYQLGGLEPSGYIAVNLGLHALNAALVFLLFARLLRDGHERWRLAWAALGALFYALHPLRVESAVWVTERRDVLSLFFLLLSLMAWLRTQDGSRRGLFYSLSLLAFALSLLSKAWGIVYPAVLLILCLYPLRRRDWGKIAAELAPFAGLAIVFAVVAALAQSEEAMASLQAHGPAARAMQAAWSPAFYLGKTIAPLDLSPLYLLRRDFSPWTPSMLLGAGVTLAITVALIAKRRQFPGLLTGWLIFLVLLAPVSGLAQSGSQLAADRYTYLAGILPALAVAAAGLWAGQRWPELRKLLAVFMVLVVALLALATTRQSQVWENADTLWSQAIEADPENYVALFNRATTGERGGAQGAINDLSRAIELDPNYASAYANRGKLRLESGLKAEALDDLDKAISLNPAPAQPYNNRASCTSTTTSVPRHWRTSRRRWSATPRFTKPTSTAACSTSRWAKPPRPSATMTTPSRCNRVCGRCTLTSACSGAKTARPRPPSKPSRTRFRSTRTSRRATVNAPPSTANSATPPPLAPTSPRLRA